MKTLHCPAAILSKLANGLEYREGKQREESKMTPRFLT